MSRRTRIEASRPVRRRPATKRKMAAGLLRELKRRLIASGQMSDPSLAPPKYEWHWAIGDRNQGGVVEANTKGEARALIKGALGLRKKDTLPSVIKIVRVTPDADTQAQLAACEIRPVSG
jgi:hypothetical protein